MAQRLSPGGVGLALFENAFATVGALVGLTLMFGPVSGAHINPIVWIVANPAVTIARALPDIFAGIAPASVPMYVGMQLIGAALAVPLILLFYPREPLE